MSTATVKVTPARVVLSEWTKLRTLRSTLFSLLAVVLFLVGFSILVTSIIASHPPEGRDAASFEPVGVSLAGWVFAQLALGVLGVLIITGEYSTGMIRASLAAVPKRVPMLWAKALVYGLTCLALTLVSVFAAFFLGQAILSSKDLQASLSDPGVARVVFGTSFYLVGVGLLGLALGALLRNTAGAISALFGLLFVVPIVVHFLPANWNDAIAKYLPSNAGMVIIEQHPDTHSLGAWTGLLVFFLYAVVALVLAGVALVRRDA
jgi:ABC-2 type transport system permease protein